MKICCGQNCKFKGKPQPLSNFHKNINQDDNHHKHCKQCRKDYGQSEKGQKTLKKHYDKNKKKIREQQIEYEKTDEGKKIRKEIGIKYKKNNPEKLILNNRKNRKNYDIANPQKTRARKLLGFAIKDGKIIKPDICSLCGKKSDKIEGHHKDYSKPYEIIWCCYDCHLGIHNKN